GAGGGGRRLVGGGSGAVGAPRLGGLEIGGVDVGADQLGAAFGQELAQTEPVVPRALHRHALAGDVAAEQRLDAIEHAARGDRRGIAASLAGRLFRQADDVGRAPRDGQHVLDAGADILGGDVAPAERFDLFAELFEAGGAVRAHAIEHRFTAAQRQLGHRVLVGHAAREAQHVGERLLGARVGPDAAAAGGGTDRGGVDGDVAGEAQLLVADLDDVLVAVIGWVIFPI